MASFEQLDESIRALAQRNSSAASKAMTAVTGKRISELLNVAESTVSQFRGEPLDKAMSVLAAAGLKVVPVAEITRQPEEVRYLLRQSIRLAERELQELGGDTRPGALE